MRRGRWSRLGVVVGAGLFGLAILGGMVTRAGAHQGDGIANAIHACVATKDGAVRLVGPTGSCNVNKETAAHWSIQGPPGEPGLLSSFDDLESLPCTTVIGTPGTAHLIGPAKSPACAVGVSANGRFVDLGLVVFDSQTNLVWEKKDQAGGLHDVDNTYTWCQATGNPSGPPGCMVQPFWIFEVNGEGGTGFAGFRDWRVPTRDELAGLLLAVCPGGGIPCIDPIFGPTAASDYWSATGFDPNFAWAVDFADGDVNVGGKSFTFRVRAVRGGP